MPIKPHILHVITGLGVGGAEQMLLRLITASRAGAFTHSVVTLDRNGTLASRIRALDVQVHELGVSIARPRLLALTRHIRDCNPTVIQGWMYHGNLAALVGSRLTRHVAPVAWNVRQTLYDLHREKLLTAAIIRAGAALSSHPAAIVYNSSTSARQHEALGYRGTRARIIPNGFDCATFSPDAGARMRMRSALGIADGSVVIALICRFHPMKDHRTFAAAAAEVARANPDVHFLLAGRGVADAESGVVQALERSGLLRRATVLGERHDVPDLLNAVDIACSSSAWGEGFSNAIGEAMACGVPCVVTDVGDSAAIVGETGHVVPPGNPVALAAALGGLVACGAERRQVLGADARRRIQECYSLPAIAAEYEAFYQALARNANTTRAHQTSATLVDH